MFSQLRMAHFRVSMCLLNLVPVNSVTEPINGHSLETTCAVYNARMDLLGMLTYIRMGLSGELHEGDIASHWSPEELMIEKDMGRRKQKQGSLQLEGESKSDTAQYCHWTLLVCEVLEIYDELLEYPPLLEYPTTNIQNYKLDVSHPPDYLTEPDVIKATLKKQCQNNNSNKIPDKCYEWLRDHSQNQNMEWELGAYLKTNVCDRRQPSILTRQQNTAVGELHRSSLDPNFRRIGASVAPLMLPVDPSEYDSSTLLPEASPNFFGVFRDNGHAITSQSAAAPGQGCPLNGTQAMPYIKIPLFIENGKLGTDEKKAPIMPFSVQYLDKAMTDSYHLPSLETLKWAKNCHKKVSEILAKSGQTISGPKAVRNFRCLLQQGCTSFKAAYTNTRLAFGRSLTIPSTTHLMGIDDPGLKDVCQHFLNLLTETLVLAVTINMETIHSSCCSAYEEVCKSPTDNDKLTTFHKTLMDYYGYVPLHMISKIDIEEALPCIISAVTLASVTGETITIPAAALLRQEPTADLLGCVKSLLCEPTPDDARLVFCNYNQANKLWNESFNVNLTTDIIDVSMFAVTVGLRLKRENKTPNKISIRGLWLATMGIDIDDDKLFNGKQPLKYNDQLGMAESEVVRETVGRSARVTTASLDFLLIMVQTSNVYGTSDRKDMCRTAQLVKRMILLGPLNPKSGKPTKRSYLTRLLGKIGECDKINKTNGEAPLTPMVHSLLVAAVSHTSALKQLVTAHKRRVDHLVRTRKRTCSVIRPRGLLVLHRLVVI